MYCSAFAARHGRAVRADEAAICVVDADSVVQLRVAIRRRPFTKSISNSQVRRSARRGADSGTSAC